MTFDANETSQEGSRPFEIYRIIQGGTSYEYTSAEDKVTVGFFEFTPEAISRSEISQIPEDRNKVFEVTVPSSNPFARQYISAVPGQRATLEVWRAQRGDSPTFPTFKIFRGFIQSVAFVDDGELAQIAALPSEAATARNIPRFTYQGLCNNVLFDADCKVNEEDFQVELTITAVDSMTITIPGLSGFPDGYFTGGFLEVLSGLDFRLILSHTGDDIEVLLPFPFGVVGLTATVFAGCDHTLPTCKLKFNNVENYGGYPYTPKKNIFKTGID